MLFGRQMMRPPGGAEKIVIKSRCMTIVRTISNTESDPVIQKMNLVGIRILEYSQE